MTAFGGTVEFDLTQMGSLEVTLLDADSKECDYAGPAYANLSSSRDGVRPISSPLGRPPFFGPVVPPGEYRIDLQLRAPSHFGPYYPTLKFDTPIEIVRGQTTRVALTAEKP